MVKGTKNYIEPATIFEKELQDLVLKKVCHYNFFIDIGAHIGHWTTYTGSQFKKVLAIEPSPENYPRLVNHCKALLNDYQLVNKAVLNKSCKTKMKKHHSLSKDPYWQGMRCYLNESSGEYDVSADTVENIVASSKFNKEPISLIKMDIEGYEPVAWLGMINLIVRHKPVLIFEIEDRWIGRSAKFLRNPKITTESFRNQICQYGYEMILLPEITRDTLFIPTNKSIIKKEWW